MTEELMGRMTGSYLSPLIRQQPILLYRLYTSGVIPKVLTSWV